LSAVKPSLSAAKARLTSDDALTFGGNALTISDHATIGGGNALKFRA
jgi:hypothetical protein